MALLSLLLAEAAAAAAAPAPERKPVPRCDGKRATIASDRPLIIGSDDHDVIVAGPGDNEIRGGGGNDTICAGGGDDLLLGGRGNDTLLGGAGEDFLNGERGSDSLNGGAGADRVLGDTGNDTLAGGAGAGDRLEGGPGDDRLDGGPGDEDEVIGGPGVDAISGGAGAHDIASFEGTGGPVTIDLAQAYVGGAEEEGLRGIEDAIGGYAEDTILGDPATPNRIDGGPGDDRLLAAGRGDEAFGGPGSDSCEGFDAVRSCGRDRDGATLSVELYRSIGGTRSLILLGTPRSDRAAIGYAAGGFVVAPLDGETEVEVGGGSGCERDPASGAVACGRVDAIVASMRAGDDELLLDAALPAEVGATLDGGSGADRLRGGPGDDVLYGGDDRAPEDLAGGAGDDVLYGVNIFHPRRDSGAAAMRGGAGEDLMVGGQPCDGDLFDGGAGENDSASFARIRNPGTVIEAHIGGGVTDPDLGCAGGRIDGSVEKIEGSPGPDVLIGGAGAETILGRGGDDRIDGRGGFDRCIQGAGSGPILNCEVDSWAEAMRGRIR